MRIRNEEHLRVAVAGTPDARRRISLVRPDGEKRTVRVTLARRGPRDLRGNLQRHFEHDDHPAGRYILTQAHDDRYVALLLAAHLSIQLPQFAEAHALKGRLLLENSRRAGRTESAGAGGLPEPLTLALGEIETSLEHGSGSLEVRKTAAEVMLKLRDFDAAEGHALAAVRIDATSARSLNLLGQSLLSTGRAPEALSHLQGAVRLNPYAAGYYRDLSACHRALGREGLARQVERSMRTLLEHLQSRSLDSPLSERSAETVSGGAVLFGALAWWSTRRRRGVFASARAAPVPGSDIPADIYLFELLGVAGLMWMAAAIPYFGAAFGLAASAEAGLEILGHLAPGLAVVLLSGVAAAKISIRGVSPESWLLKPGIYILPAVSMLGMHVPMLREAVVDAQIWPKAMLHLIPALFLGGLTVTIWLRQGRTVAGSTSAFREKPEAAEGGIEDGK